ncbi:hypothetical protein WJX72_010845 [[Myrmecia] bisecta]|uniref:Dynamin GTPase domain-containing protein n=1 Tax=[Myrmecia] bisecta TaxID=41462 RepID=A0AAW1PKW6_9CHLO
MLNVIDELQAKHFNNFELDLPTIVVIGNEACGKTSLLEAISGVQMPSGRTLTTRCPIQLKMNNVPGRATKVTIKWTPNNQTSPQVVECADVKEITELVRRAMASATGGTSSVIVDSLIEVRLRADNEREQTTQQMRDLESAFFQDEYTKFQAAYPCLTGVPLLVKQLVELLEQQLHACMPALLGQIGEAQRDLRDKISILPPGYDSAVAAQQALKDAVDEAGQHIKDLCSGHKMTIDSKDREIFPEFAKYGERFQQQVLGTGSAHLPDWFFSGECHETFLDCIRSRQGKDYNELYEHPKHPQDIFIRDVWSRLKPKGQTSPMLAMLDTMHDVVGRACRSVLADDKCNLPPTAQLRIMKQVQDNILSEQKRQAETFLDVWREAQKTTDWSFNHRIQEVSKRLEETLDKLLALPHPGHGAALDNGALTAAGEVVADFLRIALPLLGFFFGVPDVSAPAIALGGKVATWLMKLVDQIREGNKGPVETDPSGASKADAAAKMQLALAAHSELMLEQWWQQVPAAIQYFMVEKVGV